jgi:hypothetical protein
MTRSTTALFAFAAALANAGAAPGIAQTSPTAAPAADDGTLPVAAAEARAVATSLADELEGKFVFPDVGKSYAAMLRSKAAKGGYDAAGTRAALASMLTEDVQKVAADGHLRVHVIPPEARAELAARRAAADVPQAAVPAAAPVAPPSLDEARMLTPRIAYIRFSAFFGSEEGIKRAVALLEANAEAETVIFDIRTHRGGGLAEMDAILPYFFAQPTGLVQMDTRLAVDEAGGGPLSDGPRLRRLAGPKEVVRREHHVVPHEGERRLQDAKVYLLTAGRTASAAEHFALAMKRTKRATLIGEATAGAGHFGGMLPLNDNFAAFIPVGRTFDPDTGEGWEGRGVAPDVAVPAADALVEALVRSGVARAEAVTLSASVHPTASMERRRPRS